jgi:hypothetical protein
MHFCGVKPWNSVGNEKETDFLTITETGRVGLSATSPGGELSLPNNARTKKLVLYDNNPGESIEGGTTFYGFGVLNDASLTMHNAFSAGIFRFYGANTQFGYVNDASGFVTTFTGQHRSFPFGVLKSKPKADVVGLIVSSTGDYVSMNLAVPTMGKDGIRPSEAVPMISLTNSENDPAVFGVISDKEDSETRIDNYGAFKSTISATSGDTRFIVNSIGEGGIWVCDAAGPLQNGDFISSSVVPGYGQRQITEVLTKYTVAKITCDCDFSFVQVPKKKIKTRLVTKTSTSHVILDKEESTTESKVVWDDVLQKYVRKDVTDTRTVQETLWDTVDVYDETGTIVIGEHKIERTSTTTETIEEYDLDEHGTIQFIDSDETETRFEMRYLDHDGTILTETEYDTKKDAGDPVYIAAFVGCTYHCG